MRVSGGVHGERVLSLRCCVCGASARNAACDVRLFPGRVNRMLIFPAISGAKAHNADDHVSNHVI